MSFVLQASGDGDGPGGAGVGGRGDGPGGAGGDGLSGAGCVVVAVPDGVVAARGDGLDGDEVVVVPPPQPERINGRAVAITKDPHMVLFVVYLKKGLRDLFYKVHKLKTKVKHRYKYVN